MRLSFLSEAEISQLGQLIAKESEASGIFFPLHDHKKQQAGDISLYSYLPEEEFVAPFKKALF